MAPHRRVSAASKNSTAAKKASKVKKSAKVAAPSTPIRSAPLPLRRPGTPQPASTGSRPKGRLSRQDRAGLSESDALLTPVKFQENVHEVEYRSTKKLRENAKLLAMMLEIIEQQLNITDVKPMQRAGHKLGIAIDILWEVSERPRGSLADIYADLA